MRVVFADVAIPVAPRPTYYNESRGSSSVMDKVVFLLQIGGEI